MFKNESTVLPANFRYFEVLFSYLIFEDVVQGSWVTRDGVKEEDPESEGDVEDALKRGHLREDHPGIPHRVAEGASHRGGTSAKKP